MTEKELMVIELTEQSIESMVYEIRGQKVMLDFDLARIYGYTTKAFNQQVQRNIEKFPNDFMFRLTLDEIEKISRSQIVTTKNSDTNSEEISRSSFLTTMQTKGVRGGRVYLPYAFTEQGVYMLMTVLRGELAVKQSKALIRLFKRMKDFIIENKELTSCNASLINDKFASYDKRFEKVEEKLEVVMENFIDPSKYKHFLIMNGQKLEADIAYQTIYSLAKSSIYIIDDYINIKTLQLLRVCPASITITIFSDNKSKNSITKELLDDFTCETGLPISLLASNNKFHDRYIVIDYKTTDETIYHCGTSSKDAGGRVTTIIKVEYPEIYHSLIDKYLFVI